jgi:hypothetical protein
MRHPRPDPWPSSRFPAAARPPPRIPARSASVLADPGCCPSAVADPAPSRLCRERIWPSWPPLSAVPAAPGRTFFHPRQCCARLPSSAVVRLLRPVAVSLLHAANSCCRREDLCNCHRSDNHAANSLRIRICVVVYCALPRRHLCRAPVAAIADRLSNSASATRTFVNSSNSGCCQLRFLWFAWFPISCSS